MHFAINVRGFLHFCQVRDCGTRERPAQCPSWCHCGSGEPQRRSISIPESNTGVRMGSSEIEFADMMR